MKAIFLGGSIASGKTTISNKLVEEYGYKRFSIAAPLKQIAKEVLGRELDKAKDRELLQYIGNNLKFAYDMDRTTEWIKQSECLSEALNQQSNFDLLYTEEFWINWLFKSDDFKKYYMDTFKQNKDFKIIIDDFRFPSEEKYIKNWFSHEYKIGCNQGYQYDFVMLHCEQEEIIKRCMNIYGKYDPKWFEDISELERGRINFNKIIDNTRANIDDIVKLIAQ